MYRPDWLKRTTMMAASMLAMLLSTGASSKSVSFDVRFAQGVRVYTVSVDMNDPRILLTPSSAHQSPGHRKSFASFMHQKVLAQITGTYFDPVSGYPIGDIVIAGRQCYSGTTGAALAVTADNHVSIIHSKYGKTQDWPEYESVLRGGIMLVKAGRYAVTPSAQGFRDPALFRLAKRTAVGIRKGNKMIMVATHAKISLRRLAYIMQELGCVDAMTFDGGTSAGLAYKANILINPGRRLSNVLQVVQRPAELRKEPAIAKVKLPDQTQGDYLQGFWLENPMQQDSLPMFGPANEADTPPLNSAQQPDVEASAYIKEQPQIPALTRKRKGRVSDIGIRV